VDVTLGSFPFHRCSEQQWQQAATSSLWRFLTLLLQPKDSGYPLKAEACQRRHDGQSVPALQLRVLCWHDQGYGGTVTVKSLPLWLFTERGPRGDLEKHP